jgi:hypothetical protein
VKEHLGVSVYTDDLAIVEAARIEHLLGPERYQIYLNVQEMLARDAEKTASKSN